MARKVCCRKLPRRMNAVGRHSIHANQVITQSLAPSP
jgi:hypothetical protein